MKKIILISALATINACSAQSPSANSISTEECEITFAQQDSCQTTNSNQKINISIISETLSTDEKSLKALQININNQKQSLSITQDTTMLEGDIGQIAFPDINFDGVPDLALTTSFGIANLYFDYWVFDTKQQKYIAIGNHPQFTIDPNKKTIHTTTKNSASEYQTSEWYWHKDKLIKR